MSLLIINYGDTTMRNNILSTENNLGLKNQDIFDNYMEGYNKEESLWKAVILQAFADLQSNSKKPNMKNNKVKALLWFNLNNKDFITVCEYANLDPCYVWKRANFIKNNNFCKQLPVA